MLRVLRQFVHVVQNHFDHRGSLRLLVSQEVETYGPADPELVANPVVRKVRTLSRSGDAISWREAGFFEADQGGDGLILNPEDAQRIVDQLWALGHRPSEAVGSAGALTAAKDHLADMRRVVTSLLDDNPLAKLLAAANAMNDRISQFAVSQSLGDTAKVIEDQRHSEILGCFREMASFYQANNKLAIEINSFIRERANTDAADWRELSERLNAIEFSLDVNAYITEKSIPEQIESLRDDLAKQPGMVAECVFQFLSQPFENPNNAVHQRLVELGWTPPAKAEL